MSCTMCIKVSPSLFSYCYLCEIVIDPRVHGPRQANVDWIEGQDLLLDRWDDEEGRKAWSFRLLSYRSKDLCDLFLDDSVD